jgi:hypothetical protein
MRADERVEGRAGSRGGLGDPGGAGPEGTRGRPDDREDVHHVLSPIAGAAGDDDERRARGSGHGRRGPIGESATTQEVDADGVARRGRDLVDHHRDGSPAPEDVATRGHGPASVCQAHAEARAGRLPEAIDRRGAQVLGHDEELDVTGRSRCREVPVARVRGGEDDASTLTSTLASSLGQQVPPDHARSGVDRHVPERLVAAPRQPQELERGAAEGGVHRSCLARGRAQAGGAHRVLDVRAPDAKHASGEPAEQCSHDPERAPRQARDGGREETQPERPSRDARRLRAHFFRARFRARFSVPLLRTAP